MKLSKGQSSLVARMGLVVHEVFKPDATMAPRLIEGNLARLEKSNERRTTDAQEVSGLLRSHGHALRHDRNALACSEGFRDLLEDSEDLVRDRSRRAIWVDQRCFRRALLKKAFDLAKCLREVKELFSSIGLR